MSVKAAPDYGIDAPGVVRNLGIAAFLGLAIWLATQISPWNGVLHLPIPSTDVSFDLGGTAFGISLVCLVLACWMVYDSKWGKLKLRDNMLGRVQWTGAEMVLDVGCGRGLLLIGAAKRLSTGRAVGIDLWQSEDLTGNGAESTRFNVRAENVADRVEIVTSDMRDMPFEDGYFDVIISRAAVHNLYQPVERERAIKEIVRVLKPGGVALIDDIRHIGAYRGIFTHLNCSVTRSGSRIAGLVLLMLTFGSLNPGLLIVKRESPV